MKSRPGEGSRFAVTIYLKFLDVQNAEAHKEDPLKNLEDLKFEGKRILLVEDHPVNAEIAKNVLQMTGLEVEWVMDGEAAVERMAGSNENSTWCSWISRCPTWTATRRLRPSGP